MASVPVAADGSFSTTVSLDEGVNVIHLFDGSVLKNVSDTKEHISSWFKFIVGANKSRKVSDLY